MNVKGQKGPESAPGPRLNFRLVAACGFWKDYGVGDLWPLLLFSTRPDGYGVFARRRRRSPSMAPNMFDCTSGNFAGSIVSGLPPPAYFAKTFPILRRFERTFLAFPWSTSCRRSVRSSLISENELGHLPSNRDPTDSRKRK